MVDMTKKGMNLETKAPDLDIRVDRTYQPPLKADLPASAGGGGIPQIKQPIPPSTPRPEAGGGVPQVSSLPTRGLKTEPMSAPNMGGIRTGQMPAQGAEDFMDAYEVATQGRSPYEAIQAPSSRGLRRVAMQQPNMGGLRLPQASQYARALEILKRI